MKWFSFLATAALLSTVSSAWTQQEIYSDVGSESIDQSNTQGSPFSFSAFTDVAGKAKINKGDYKNDKFQFGIANAELSCVYYYRPEYSEAANVALAYTETYYGWKNNPWFNQKHFHTLTLSFGGTTKRFDRWIWRGLLQANYDGFKKFDAEYFNYNIMLWGRYELFCDVGIHMGFYVETGMRMDRIYPIFGFDWQISEKWKLNAVFPFDMALSYLINEQWTISLAGRTFSSRHRTNNHKRQPESSSYSYDDSYSKYYGSYDKSSSDSEDDCHSGYLARYTNFGIEAMLKYAIEGFTANIHAGFTTGGNFRVANSHNHHPRHYHLDPTGYIGALIEKRF